MNNVTEQKKGPQPAARSGADGDRRAESVLRPLGDIFEKEDGITIVLDMPGVSKERLEINTDRNNLVVEGEVEIDMPQDTESLYADVRCTRYRRAFSLSGEQLDTEGVQASMKDGVLRIHIPRREEMKPRKIEVKSG
jgi:HSP20 family protein